MGNFINKLQCNFSTIPNALTNDKRLSMQARFVYVFMASKPSGWDFLIEVMSSEIGCNKKTLEKYVKELIKYGWLVKGKQKNESGKFGAVEYTLMDNTTVAQNTADQNTADQNLGHGNNKDITNNYKTNNYINNTEEAPLYPPKENSEEAVKEEEKEKDCAEKEKEKEWDEVLQPWLEYKKDRKQAYKGERALKALRTKLKNLSGGNVEIARLIIEQSMANNWAGLFKLHDQGVMGTAPRKMNANDEAFDEIYREIFKTGFVWQEDTTAEIQKLADAIASKAPDENYSISPGEMPMLIKFFLQKAWAIEDQWLREHFTPKNINNQFNTIYAYIKSGRKSSNGRKNNPYGVSEEFLAELGQGLSDTAQRFQAAFGGDDNH